MDDAELFPVQANEQRRGVGDGEHGDQVWINTRVFDRSGAKQDGVPIGAGAATWRHVGGMLAGSWPLRVGFAVTTAAGIRRRGGYGDLRQLGRKQATPSLRQRQQEAAAQQQHSSGAAHTRNRHPSNNELYRVPGYLRRGGPSISTKSFFNMLFLVASVTGYPVL